MEKLVCNHVGCGQTLSPPILRCTRCKKRSYCSRTCQIAAWKSGHKQECDLFCTHNKCAALVASRTPPTPAHCAPVQLWTQLQKATNAADDRKTAVSEALAQVRAEMSEFVNQHAQNQRGKDQKGAEKRRLQSRIRKLEQDEKDARTALQTCRLAEFPAMPSPDQFGIAKQHQQLYQAGDFAGAVAMDEVMDVARAISKTWPEGANQMMTIRGRAFYDLGQYPEAIAVLEEGLAISKIVYPSGEPNNLHTQAEACAAMGQFRRAIQLFENAIDLKDLLGNTSSDYIGLGKVYSHLGQHKRAHSCFEKSLEIALETESLVDEAAAYSNLAPWHAQRGDYQIAFDLQMKKALPIAVQSGNRHMEGRVYQNVTWVLQSMGQHQRSLEMSVEALIIAREVGDTATECAVFDNLSTAYMALGKYARAVEFESLRLEMTRERRECKGSLLSLRHTRLHSLMKLALLSFLTGDESEAFNLLQAHLDLAVSGGARKECNSCGQARGDAASVLSCAACGVARYCHAECQKKNWDGASDTGMPKHRHLCPLWQHARDIVKGKAPLHSSSLQERMRVFLQACNARHEAVKAPLTNAQEERKFEEEESMRIQRIQDGISVTLAPPLGAPDIYRGRKGQHVGERVQIRGLISALHWNGFCGTISKTVDDGRVVVDLEEDADGNLLPVGTDKQLKLKLENLLAIQDEQEDWEERNTSSPAASALRSSIQPLCQPLRQPHALTRPRARWRWWRWWRWRAVEAWAAVLRGAGALATRWRRDGAMPCPFLPLRRHGGGSNMLGSAAGCAVCVARGPWRVAWRVQAFWVGLL